MHIGLQMSSSVQFMGMWIRLHVHTQELCMHMCVHVCMHIYMYIHNSVYICVCMHVCRCVYLGICEYLYVWLCVGMCVYAGSCMNRKPGGQPSMFLQCCLPGFMRQDLSLAWNSSTTWEWLAREPQGSFCLYLCTSGTTSTRHHAQILLWVLRIKL